MQQETLDLAAARLKKYRKDPVLFSREVMRLEPDDNQQLILKTIADHDRVAIRSGHGIGKTLTLGGIVAPWFLTCFEKSKVITTAPTWRQVNEVLWAELHSRVRKSLLGSVVELQHTKAILDKDWFAIGISSDVPSNIEGFHAPHIMYIIDEAKGVNDEILNALEGALTTDAKVVYISTPGAPEGKFYQAFTKESSIWKTLHIPSAKKINGNWVPNSKWITQKWIDERLAEWGEDSPLFRMRVMGEFVEEAENALILLRWLQAAAKKYAGLPLNESNRKLPEVTKRIVGLDVADMGPDRTVYQIVDHMNDGTKIRRHVKSHSKIDTYETAERCDELMMEWECDQVNIDSVGLGIGVLNDMRRIKRDRDRKYIVNGINVGTAATTGRDRFMRKKEQYWWAVRQMFEEGVVYIPDDEKNDKTYEELSTMKWETTPAEKIKIVDPKDKSPDFADALMLALNKATPSAMILEGLDL